MLTSEKILGKDYFNERFNLLLREALLIIFCKPLKVTSFSWFIIIATSLN